MASELLEALIKSLPEEPGVYLMKDKNGKIIYVGKAKILKNRVRQYFQSQEKHAPKVRAMVSNICSFEYIITDSEIEALILECNLIKKHRPYYNILLKDDKQFPYIKITMQEDYPRMQFTRKLKKDGARYFGPYVSSFAVHEVMDVIRKTFRIPTCNIRLPQDIGKKKACLNMHIGQCFAPCVQPTTKYEYKKVFSDVCRFLDGDHDTIIREMEQEMQQASDALEFERAASLRDKINSLTVIAGKQKMVSERQADEDVIALYNNDNKTFVEAFFIRRGRLLGRDYFVLDRTQDTDPGEVISDFMKQFYESAVYIPRNIYVQYAFEDIPLMGEWLTRKKGKKVEIRCPKRGDKLKLVQMVEKNARQSALEYLLKHSQRERLVNKAVVELSEALNLGKMPNRIEAYDITTSGGGDADTLGSMVVFIDGRPIKKHYRRFRIQTVEGVDDYKATSEMLYRRLRGARDEQAAVDAGELEPDKAKFLPLPDCIFLDGGKGHVHVVSELLELLDADIPLFGMVKDNRHRTRALINAKGEEIALKQTSAAFRLITAMQDEVHRFAVDYLKRARKKKITGSELLKIEGVGQTTAKKLLKAFRSMERIKQASAAELAEIGKIPRKTSENIYNYFAQRS